MESHSEEAFETINNFGICWICIWLSWKYTSYKCANVLCNSTSTTVARPSRSLLWKEGHGQLQGLARSAEWLGSRTGTSSQLKTWRPPMAAPRAPLPSCLSLKPQVERKMETWTIVLCQIWRIWMLGLNMLCKWEQYLPAMQYLTPIGMKSWSLVEQQDCL